MRSFNMKVIKSERVMKVFIISDYSKKEKFCERRYENVKITTI